MKTKQTDSSLVGKGGYQVNSSDDKKVKMSAQ